MELVAGENDCCFALSYALSPSDQFNTFEVSLPPEDEFAAFNLDLGSNWQTAPLTTGNGYLIYRPNLANLPLAADDFLEICLNLPAGRTATSIQIGWSRDGGQVQLAETLAYNCYACNLPLRDSIVCRPDGGYDYYFQFTNRSEFAVNELRFWEDEGGGDFIEANSLEMSNAVPPGLESEWLLLPLTASAEALDELCFSITSSRQENGIYLDCCTGYHCVNLPQCDRCCTEYILFEEDVNDGFFVDFNNGSFCDSTQMMVVPRSLTNCDATLISRRRLNEPGGIAIQSSGNQPAIFPSLSLSGEYEVCLVVTREDLDGIACYETTSLTVCDTISVNCEDCLDPELIDQTVACELPVDYSCACDSMIYLNECTAENWSGIRRFLPDTTHCMQPPITISLSVTPQQSDLSSFNLEWSDLSGIGYRHYLVRFRYLGEPWETLAEFDGSITAFTHSGLSQNEFEYQIIGVNSGGKLFVSETIYATETTEPEAGGGVVVFPNPATALVTISSPTSRIVTATLHNLHGSEVLRKTSAPSTTLQLRIHELPAGSYLLVYTLENGARGVRRVVKG